MCIILSYTDMNIVAGTDPEINQGGWLTNIS